MDPDGEEPASGHKNAVTLRSRPRKIEVPYLDYEIPLRFRDCVRSCVVRDRRLAVPDVGSLPANCRWPALYLAGEFRDAHLGIAALPHERHVNQQLADRDAHLRRRLAQQSPRASCFRATWAQVVRV